MEFKEISVPEGIVQQIGHEGSFAGITVDVENKNYLSPSANPDVSYEDTLEDIDLERARYLLNTDEMLEEMLSRR